MTKFSNQTTILEFLSDSRVWIMSYKIWVRVMDIELWKRSRRDEYFQNEFSIFCSEHGISHQSSALKLLMKKKNCRHNKYHNLKQGSEIRTVKKISTGH